MYGHSSTECLEMANTARIGLCPDEHARWLSRETGPDDPMDTNEMAELAEGTAFYLKKSSPCRKVICFRLL